MNAQPRKRCILFHSWDHPRYTCATYSDTGPLPGESHTHNGAGYPGYRYERQCNDCELREYHAFHERWLEIPLPLQKATP